MNAQGLLTPKEKDAIRNSCCVLCLALPPFADGSRCHPHRIVRAKLGGQYTPDNVIALCPSCHHAVDRVPLIEAALNGGKRCQWLHPEQFSKMGRKGGVRRHELHPDSAKAWGRQLGTQYGPRLTPEQRLKGARIGHHNRTARQHRDGLTPKELAHMHDMARKSAGAGARAVKAKYTRAERSEWARRREAQKPVTVRLASTGKANRAAVARMRRDGPTPKQLSHLRSIARKGNLAMQEKYRVLREGRS